MPAEPSEDQWEPTDYSVFKDSEWEPLVSKLRKNLSLRNNSTIASKQVLKPQGLVELSRNETEVSNHSVLELPEPKPSRTRPKHNLSLRDNSAIALRPAPKVSGVVDMSQDESEYDSSEHHW